jgi:hypothetical protein
LAVFVGVLLQTDRRASKVINNRSEVTKVGRNHQFHLFRLSPQAPDVKLFALRGGAITVSVNKANINFPLSQAFTLSWRRLGTSPKPKMDFIRSEPIRKELTKQMRSDIISDKIKEMEIMAKMPNRTSEF